MTNVNPAPANDNKPSQFNVQTLYAVIRIILGMAAAGTLGVKAQQLLPQSTVDWINAQLPIVIPGAIAFCVFVYGAYTRTRSGLINSTAKLPGAVVALDSQAEANAHPSPSVVGPKDPLPVKAAA